MTEERREHILRHPEMTEQLAKLCDTVETPGLVVATKMDETVHVYHRFFTSTPVTSKYLLVAVKMLDDDAFVLTAFFSKRVKKGEVIWRA